MQIMRILKNIRSLIIIYFLSTLLASGLQAQVEGDTIKTKIDSILDGKSDSLLKYPHDSLRVLKLIDSLRNFFPDSSYIRNLTDSLYYLHYQDSLAQAQLIDSISWMYESLKTEVLIDSLNRANDDSLRRTFNNSARTVLRDSIQKIDDDSVRNTLYDISDHVFGDEIFEVDQFNLKNKLDRLIRHLAIDSTNVWIINSRRDTSLLKLNKFKSDSLVVWLQNSLNDSAKVYFQTIDKHSVKMWIDDDIYLRYFYRKQLDEDILGNDFGIYRNYKPKKTKLIPIPKSPWQWWGDASLHLAQGIFSNWARGGESSVSAEALFHEYCNYTMKNSKWENSFLFQYGLLKSGNYDSYHKNKDRFEIKSKFGQKALKHWYYTVFANINSQSFKGYNYPNDSVPVSKFLAPAIIKFGVGMDYKPNKKLTVLMAPLAAKFTLVLDTVLIDHTKFGLAEDEKMRKEMGATMNLRYKSTIAKNIVLENKLILFSNYMDKPQNIDINWEITLDMKVNQYISAKLSTHLIYDDNILIPLYEKIDGVKTKVGTGKRIQFQESLTVGLSYRF